MMFSLLLKPMVRRSEKSTVILFGLLCPVGKETCGSNGLAVEVMDKPVESREETSKYTDTLADGISRKWTWAMDAKSVVTSPSPQSPITHGKAVGYFWFSVVWAWRYKR